MNGGRSGGDRTRSPFRSSTPEKSFSEKFREVLVTGLAVLIPAVASIYVLYLLAGIIFDLLTPFTSVVDSTLGIDKVLGGSQYTELIIGVLTVLILFFLAIFIGVLARSEPGDRAITTFEVAISSIPGIGVMYESFQKLSNVLLEDRKNQFQEVKLVEFPHEDTYTLGFETTKTPESINEASGCDEDMVTLFLPLAPNPFIGGFLAHIPESRVTDVDMSVEEGIATVLTVGVGTPTDKEVEEIGLSEIQLEPFNREK